MDSVNCRLQVRISLRSDRKSTACFVLLCFHTYKMAQKKKKKPNVQIAGSVLVVNVQLFTCSDRGVDLKWTMSSSHIK